MTQANRVLGGPDVNNRLKVNNNIIVTTQDCYIEAPVRFMERDLGDIGESILVYGLFAIIFSDGKYRRLNICAKVHIYPHHFEKVVIDEIDYYRFHFQANAPIMDKIVVRNDLLLYEAFDEFVYKGKFPWYIDSELKAKIFDTAKTHAASNISESTQAAEFILGATCRDKRNKKMLIRQTAKSKKEFNEYNYDVGIANVYYGIKSPFAKIIGPYFKETIISNLVSESRSVGKTEAILRA